MSRKRKTFNFTPLTEAGKPPSVQTNVDPLPYSKNIAKANYEPDRMQPRRYYGHPIDMGKKANPAKVARQASAPKNNSVGLNQDTPYEYMRVGKHGKTNFPLGKTQPSFRTLTGQPSQYRTKNENPERLKYYPDNGASAYKLGAAAAGTGIASSKNGRVAAKTAASIVAGTKIPKDTIKLVKSGTKLGKVAGAALRVGNLGNAAFDLATVGSGIYIGGKYLSNRGLSGIKKDIGWAAKNPWDATKQVADTATDVALGIRPFGTDVPKWQQSARNTRKKLKVSPNMVKNTYISNQQKPYQNAGERQKYSLTIKKNPYSNQKVPPVIESSYKKTNVDALLSEIGSRFDNDVSLGCNDSEIYCNNKFSKYTTQYALNGYMTFDEIISLYEGDKEHQDALDKTGFWGKRGAGAIIMAHDTGRILLPKRSQYVQEPHTWGVWGGAIEDGENPLEAAKREIHEESGYVGKLLDVIPLFVYKNGTFKYYNYLIIVEHEFDPKLDWETEEAHWFELGDFPAPLHFGLQAVLNDQQSVGILKKYSYGDEK